MNIFLQNLRIFLILEKFYFSISISRHFHFTFYLSKSVNQIFISLLEKSESDFHFTFSLIEKSESDIHFTDAADALLLLMLLKR